MFVSLVYVKAMQSFRKIIPLSTINILAFWLSSKTAATSVPSEANVAASDKSVGDASAEVSISIAAEVTDTASSEVSMAYSTEVPAAAS